MGDHVARNIVRTRVLTHQTTDFALQSEGFARFQTPVTEGGTVHYDVRFEVDCLETRERARQNLLALKGGDGG